MVINDWSEVATQLCGSRFRYILLFQLDLVFAPTHTHTIVHFLFSRVKGLVVVSSIFLMVKFQFGLFIFACDLH